MHTVYFYFDRDRGVYCQRDDILKKNYHKMIDREHEAGYTIHVSNSIKQKVKIFSSSDEVIGISPAFSHIKIKCWQTGLMVSGMEERH